MKAFTVPLFRVILAALFAVAADQSQPPTAGNLAPAFTLPNQDGVQVSLDQFKGKWVVLYFYPKDFSSGCTVEAHNFQRDLDKYTPKNAVIVGVSVDTVDSHKSFCTKEGCPRPAFVDYKDVLTLKKLCNTQGKMVSRKRSGSCAAFQRVSSTSSAGSLSATIPPPLQ